MKKTLGFVGLALGLVALLWWLRAREQAQKDRNYQQFQAPILNVNPETIDALALELPSERITLKRDGERWVMPHRGGMAANPVYVSSLLDALLTTPKGSVVSRDPAAHKRYELDAKARVIIATDAENNELGRIYVGKSGGNVRTTYIRLRDEPEVRFVAADLIPLTSRASWADHQVWNISTSAVTSYTLIKQGVSQQFEPGSDGYEALPSAWLNLVAKQVVWPCPEQSSDHELIIHIDQVTMRLELWKTDQWYAKRPNQAYCYVMADEAMAVLLDHIEGDMQH